MDEAEKKRFQKVQEDFNCVHCDARISGTGYTNHCPHCLWSLHVDINPGDRAAGCSGPMYPVNARKDSRRGVMILHRCESCGHEKPNKAAPEDNVDIIAGLMM